MDQAEGWKEVFEPQAPPAFAAQRVKQSREVLLGDLGKFYLGGSL